jgi:phytanoyl-CoA hydroxylase
MFPPLAGSITIHHLRTVHGSATNFSGRSRRFPLYQYRAADAWPLLGLKEGIEKFNEPLIVGEPSLAPRLVPLPVRMPLPPAAKADTLDEALVRQLIALP